MFVVLLETVFGWVVSGPGQNVDENTTFHSYAASCQTDVGFDLKRFWEIEEPPNCHPELTPEEVACEQHFDETTIQNNDGRKLKVDA